ncbi:MAG: hypothetical protein FWD36_00675 [Treponema sp.]|nr:hypothetical protein [Treponema sp.]
MKHPFVFCALFFVLCALILSSCSNPFWKEVEGITINPLTPIDITAITGVTPPEFEGIPKTAIDETEQFTGTVTWSPTVIDTFAADTVYTATITLTAKDGFTTEGLAADFFTVAGATPVTYNADRGRITAVFPATGSVPPTPIDIFAIAGVTPPVLGATPVTTVTETLQYTGSVQWAPNPLVPDPSGTFAAATTYIATIRLTALPGFTLNGVAANSFTVAGTAVPATNDANSGEVTAIFPATLNAVIDIFTITGVTPPVLGEPPATEVTETDQFTGLVAWSVGGTAFTGDTFAAATVYTATITLTAKTSFTFNGVPANSFTVAGTSTPATNLAGTNATITVTAVFPETAPAVIDIVNIAGVTPPATGETPVTEVTETPQFTGEVEWDPEVTGTFAPSTRYTARIRLTAKPGYTLDGVDEDFFDIPGAESVTYDPDTGYIIAVFPETTAALPDPVDILAIAGVTPPAVGAIPVTEVTETAQYTGTVEWSVGGTDFTGTTFAGEVVYTATIRLTAKTGFTFTGVGQNTFTVTGAVPPATNPANSGVVTAVFPATAPAVVTLTAIQGITRPAPGGTPTTTITPTTQFTGTVTWSVGGIAFTGDTFTNNTTYTATITLTARTGFTFNGVAAAANHFTVAGAVPPVTNLAGTNATITVTAVFPETGAKPYHRIYTTTINGEITINGSIIPALPGGDGYVEAEEDSIVAVTAFPTTSGYKLINGSLLVIKAPVNTPNNTVPVTVISEQTDGMLGTYSFTMPSQNVLVSVGFYQEQVLPPITSTDKLYSSGTLNNVVLTETYGRHIPWYADFEGRSGGQAIRIGPNEFAPQGSGFTLTRSTGINLNSVNALSFWVRSPDGSRIQSVQFGAGTDHSVMYTGESNEGIEVGTAWTRILVPVPSSRNITINELFKIEISYTEENRTLYIDDIEFITTPVNFTGLTLRTPNTVSLDTNTPVSTIVRGMRAAYTVGGTPVSLFAGNINFASYHTVAYAVTSGGASLNGPQTILTANTAGPYNFRVTMDGSQGNITGQVSGTRFYTIEDCMPFAMEHQGWNGEIEGNYGNPGPGDYRATSWRAAFESDGTGRPYLMVMNRRWDGYRDWDLEGTVGRNLQTRLNLNNLGFPVTHIVIRARSNAPGLSFHFRVWSNTANPPGTADWNWDVGRYSTVAYPLSNTWQEIRIPILGSFRQGERGALTQTNGDPAPLLETNMVDGQNGFSRIIRWEIGTDYNNSIENFMYIEYIRVE